MSDNPAEKLPTTALPQVTAAPQKTGVALPPKAATPDTGTGSGQQGEMPADPLDRRVYTLHALVVQQQVTIGTLKSDLADLKKRIEDFNTRSPHKI